MRHTNLIPISAKLVLILDSILLNRLTYCQQVWHYCKASDLQKIDRLQERGLGVVYKDQQAISLRFSNRNKPIHLFSFQCFFRLISRRGDNHNEYFEGYQVFYTLEIPRIGRKALCGVFIKPQSALWGFL